MPRLTEANYQSRRIKIREQVEAARTAHSDVGLKREFDEATDEEVTAAKDRLTGLEDRVVALDAAFQRSQQEAAADARRARDAEAAEAHVQISDALAKRKEAGENMEKAAEMLSAWYTEYNALGSDVINTALRHKDRFGQEQIYNLRDLFKGDFHDVRPAIGRTLTRGGLNMTGIICDGFGSDAPHHQSISAFIDWSAARAAGHVTVLLDKKEPVA